MEVIREPSTMLSENTLRHIMQLVSLGTGLDVPPPLSLRYREKSLKRARISAPHPRHQDFIIGSEFLGKRSIPKDKRMGSEFLGKRMGSEFLGKRMGSEFLGKRMGSEFLGKRMGSEFLGKRIGSEFLGKRMGSEFLGKRSEVYDDDDDVSLDDAPFKRMGSEFLEWGRSSWEGSGGRRRRQTDEPLLERRSGEITQHRWLKYFWFFVISADPEDTYSPDWMQDRQDKRLSEFLGGPGKRVSEFLGGPGKRISEFLGGPGKRVSEFLGGPGKRVSEFLGGPGKRSDYYDFLETAERR
ncbi:uncharacterized protein NPIL_611451 [Nephila pilipes]|uniref:Uncharacterized protein n=1 Tax=Nephila pilipes TaxID=299642 RepID=A0A8X6MND6_NEPPI|nr:uncharacterized protein NPIL_611451 [Nephila pilipes]